MPTNLKFGTLRSSTIFGMQPAYSTCSRIFLSKQMFFNTPKANCNKMLLLQLKKRPNFSTRFSSNQRLKYEITIYSLFSDIMLSFLKKSKITMSKWKSFLSNSLMRKGIILLFFIFFSIYLKNLLLPTLKSSAMFRRILNNMQNNLSYLAIIKLSFLNSLS